MSTPSEAPAADVRPIPAAVVVAIVGTALAVAQLAWFVHVRHLGSFNIDESGYLANSLRGQIWTSNTGPLTPWVSAALLSIGPRSVAAVWLAQPIAAVATAVSVTGLTARIAGRGAAIVAGLVALALPANLLLARSYQFAPAASACLVGAVWALAASDRGRRWPPMLAFGALVGAMLLTRTMTIGFVPGLVLAVLLVVERSRRSVATVSASAAVAAAVALPWWIHNWSVVVPYLFKSGYGERSHLYGSGAVSDRLTRGISVAVTDVRLPFLLLAVLAAGLVLSSRRSVGRSERSGWRAALDAHRELAAVGVVVVVGYAALASTANWGSWFELPLESLAVAGVVALGAALPDRRRRLVGSIAVAIVVTTTAVSFTDTGAADGGGVVGTARDALWTGLASANPFLTAADHRLASRHRAVRLRASAAWWRSNTAVGAAVDRAAGSAPILETVVGSAALINTQTLRLADGLGPRSGHAVEDAETNAPLGELRPLLRPRAQGFRRVLVVIHTRTAPFPAYRGRDAFQQAASDVGWRPDRVVSLPDGGRVVVLTHG